MVAGWCVIIDVAFILIVGALPMVAHANRRRERLRTLTILERLRTERVGTPDFDVLTEAIRRVSR